MELRVIQTEYDGHRFRSRLEARWAVFFKTLGINYVYEKEGYDVPGAGWYLPDFWLPGVSVRSEKQAGIWAEVKPQHPDSELSKYQALATLTGNSLIVLAAEEVCNEGFVECMDGGGLDYGMAFMQCTDSRCGHVKIEFALESTYRECPNCGEKASTDTEAIKLTIKAANFARFEHGERS